MFSGVFVTTQRIAKVVAFGEKSFKSIQIFQIYFVRIQKNMTFLSNKFA